MLLQHYITAGYDKLAGQLFFTAGRPPLYRDSDGRLQPFDDTKLTPEALNELAAQVVHNPREIETLAMHGEIETALSFIGQFRCRVNIFTQRGSKVIVVTYLGNKVVNDLRGLSIYGKLKLYLDAGAGGGVIFINGNDYADKDGLLACMVDYYNQGGGMHIITLDDTLQILHRHGNSIVNQRELPEELNKCASIIDGLVNTGADVAAINSVKTESLIYEIVSVANRGVTILALMNEWTNESLLRVFKNQAEKTEHPDFSTKLKRCFKFMITVKEDNIANETDPDILDILEI